MGRLRYKEPEEVPVEVLRVYDEFKKIRGNIPNMFKTLAYAPQLMTATYEYFKTVMKSGAVDIKLKEMLAVRVSQIHRCHYCLASHTLLAKRCGVTDEQIQAMNHLSANRHLFSDAELTALEFAEQFCNDSHAVSDETFQRLQSFFSEEAIIEISCVIGLFCFFNRFNNALKTDITQTSL